MNNINKVSAIIKLRAELNNPALFKRIVMFSFVYGVLHLASWAANAGVLVYNLTASDMGWALAVVIFCCVWLTIWTWIRFIMAPIGRSLALQQHEELLKVISQICEEA